MPSNSENASSAQGTWFSKPSPTGSGLSFGTWNDEDEALGNLNKREYPSDKYVRGSVLGQGAWSVVYKIKRISDGKLFAGKASSFDSQLYSEIDNLVKFSHKHVLKFVELHQQGDAHGANILVTELCAGGDLGTHIYNASRGMGRVDILHVLNQVTDALAFLHTNNYYHSDIKPRNILIRKLDPIDVVLADCADCELHGKEIYGDRKAMQTGTHKFWSPEMAANKPHDGRADDMWALGISLLGMMAQMPRMEITYQKKIYRDVRKFAKCCASHAQELDRLNPEDGLVKLASQMLVPASEGRITAPDCNQKAKELLEQMNKDGEDAMGKGAKSLQIQSPEDFKPVSFW